MDLPTSPKYQRVKRLVARNFYDCIFEDTLVSVIFKVHRDLAIGKMTKIKEKEESDINLPSTSVEVYDIFGHEANISKRSIECKCFVCNRIIAAARFMPHLEKCIGIGRNSRVSRRKVPNYAENLKLPSIRSQNSSNNLFDLYENDYLNEEDDEWSNSSIPKKRPRTRASRRAKNNV